MTWFRRLVPRGTVPPWVVAVVVALVVVAGVIGLRVFRVLEPVELAVYDAFIRAHAAPPGSPPDPRILIVAITEEDIQEQGMWPFPDGLLAQGIDTLLALGPRAIGLDIYRDVPVPPGSAELEAVLRRDQRNVVVTKFAEGSSKGVRPPPALKGTEQVSFNDIVVDPGGTVRRALLFLDDGQTTLYSFALRLSLLFLARDGLGLGADPADPTIVRLGRSSVPPLAPSDGPYAGVDAGGYQFLADFRAGLRSFERVPLGAVLRGKVPREAVKDRVVLIGVTAESLRDDFYIPLSHARFGSAQPTQRHIPGVEVHAHFASQLLRMAIDGSRPLGSPAKWPEWLWIALWAGLGALLGTRTLNVWWLTLAVTAGLGCVGAVGYLAFVAGWWWPVVPPGLAWLSATGFVVAYESYRGSAERGTLMKLFSQHVSKEVAEAIWREREQFAEGGRPQPRRLVVTALFTDLAGFTTVSERITPEQLMDWLNEYMSHMAQEISRYGGVISQYSGDAIVVLFGVPVPRHTDAEIAKDAINAVRCALAMSERLLSLNQRWQAEGQPMVGMRAGILTGPAVAGTLGSTDRFEYVVLGDTLNTASRLESFDKDVHPPDPLVQPCRILIGGSTLEHVGDVFETEWVAEARLKGKQQLVAIYRVLGERKQEPIADWIEPAVESRPV